ncbi:uncharacterized protein LOC116205846 isoform X2 [Punica granatum]|nr:uncharacterized protein LOC116205846 isoform X2 [Punica granatum]XP_031394386.1 uncharacterized protein LOC116205846 isoform X2 [Punica granatum]
MEQLYSCRFCVNMLREAFRPVETHFIRASTKDRDLKGSNSNIAFSMTKNESQDNLNDGDSVLHPPHVRFQKFGVGVSRSPFSVRLVLHRKSSFRNRTKKRPDAVLGGGSSHELLEGGRQSNLTQMDLLLNLSLSGEHCLLRNDHELYQEHLKPGYRLYDQQNFDLPICYSSKVEEMMALPESMRQACDLFYSPPRRTMIGRRKKLLILDINGLLADIVSPPPKECKADIKIARRAVFKRPFCTDFMKFCFERFDVGIWSSRTRKNVEKVVDYLMGDMKRNLLFCWDLSHCTPTRFNTLENRHKALVFKEVRRIWEKYDPNLPWERGYYNESNTLLLDDSPYKALLNPPHTAIFPRSFSFQNKSDTSLGHGGDLQVYLEELAAATDVQKYVAQHPFGQRAITEGSSSWGFYLRVLKSVTRRYNTCLYHQPCLRC